LEQKIHLCFPLLILECNNRNLLGIELDFYFPEIRLAIEINGIVHYEPIYGSKTFERIQNVDEQKIIQTSELGIELIIVPTFGHFTTKHAELIWNSIYTIISSRI
jgi:dTDP-4-amino-4,6-dideoxygalactose transaminase